MGPPNRRLRDAGDERFVSRVKTGASDLSGRPGRVKRAKAVVDHRRVFLTVFIRTIKTRQTDVVAADFGVATVFDLFLP